MYLTILKQKTGMHFMKSLLMQDTAFFVNAGVSLNQVECLLSLISIQMITFPQRLCSLVSHMFLNTSRKFRSSWIRFQDSSTVMRSMLSQVTSQCGPWNERMMPLCVHLSIRSYVSRILYDPFEHRYAHIPPGKTSSLSLAVIRIM